MAKLEVWKSFFVLNAVILINNLAVTRSIPPISDDFYEEFYNLLKEHQQNRFSSIPQPIEVAPWPIRPLALGQVAGIAVDNDGNPVVFHRGRNVWDENSFNSSDVYQQADKGPIPEDTILTLDKVTGLILNGWGRDKFYMPHGLTIDKDGNTWVTDVALHQVFKFPAKSKDPSIVLGEAFVPGNDKNHFCKPTDVAVASNGEFFVSDGYCNSRILKYSSDGKVEAQFGQSEGPESFLVAHSLALLEERDLICLADREGGRIVCYSAGLGKPETPEKLIYDIRDSQLGRVFAITTYDYNQDCYLFAVTGESYDSSSNRRLSATGLTIRMPNKILNEEIVNFWNSAKEFKAPHDVSISPDGEFLYVAEIGPNRVIKFKVQH